jgi:hypothetical protein
VIYWNIKSKNLCHTRDSILVIGRAGRDLDPSE